MPSDEELRKMVSDPTLSYWFKSALTEALKRDPLDAANDAGLLALVLDKRANDILASQAAQAAIYKAKG